MVWVFGDSPSICVPPDTRGVLGSAAPLGVWASYFCRSSQSPGLRHSALQAENTLGEGGVNLLGDSEGARRGGVGPGRKLSPD